MIDLTNARWFKKGDLLIKGKHAFITREGRLLSGVCSRYGRNPETTCIKAFYGNPLEAGQVLDDALWGDNRRSTSDLRLNSPLVESTQIQNILWKEGISPRVYAIFEAKLKDERVACHLTDFVEGKETEDIQDRRAIYANVNEMGKLYGFKSWKNIMNDRDVINGKFVDPQTFSFEDVPYLEYVKKTYCEEGRYGKIYYQDEPGIGLTGGPRKSADRVKYMALDKIDFAGKVVWDIGCAGGYFCRYAMDRGAKRVIGFDTKKTLEATFHVGNYLKYFNIDYVACDLKQRIPIDDIPKADIAFFLSMNLHVGVPEQLLQVVDTAIFEDNGRESRNDDKLGEPWTNHYKDIKFVGRGEDHGNKAVYHLRRND